MPQPLGSSIPFSVCRSKTPSSRLSSSSARVLEPGVKKVFDIRAYALRCTLSRRPLAVRLMPRRLAE